MNDRQLQCLSIRWIFLSPCSLASYESLNPDPRRWLSEGSQNKRKRAAYRSEAMEETQLIDDSDLDLSERESVDLDPDVCVASLL